MLGKRVRDVFCPKCKSNSRITEEFLGAERGYVCWVCEVSFIQKKGNGTLMMIGPSDDDLIANIDWDLMEKLFPTPHSHKVKAIFIGNPTPNSHRLFNYFLKEGYHEQKPRG